MGTVVLADEEYAAASPAEVFAMSARLGPDAGWLFGATGDAVEPGAVSSWLGR